VLRGRGSRESRADRRRGAALTTSAKAAIAAKRFIADRIERFIERFTAEMRRGAWATRSTGRSRWPAGAARLRANPTGKGGIGARGAQVVLGGELPAGPGAFYPPTVLVAVDRACRRSTRKRSVRRYAGSAPRTRERRSYRERVGAWARGVRGPGPMRASARRELRPEACS
jgi:hypothetical protein